MSSYLLLPSRVVRSERLRLMPRMRGGALRSRVQLASGAYSACYIEAAELFCDWTPAGGVTVPGRMPSLEIAFGREAFGGGGHRFTDFLADDTPLGRHLAEAWQDCQELVHQRPAVTGVLDRQVQMAGGGRGRR